MRLLRRNRRNRWQEHLFNGVVVEYTDIEGNVTTVGPPGSNAKHHDHRLLDHHPAFTIYGIQRRWSYLKLQQVATPASAATVGSVWLAEQRKLCNRRRRRLHFRVPA